MPQTAPKVSTYTTKEHEDGSIQIDGEGYSFRFREPVGKDLAALERHTGGLETVTDAESMAFIMSALATTESSLVVTPEDFLELPLKLFKYIAQELNQFFLA
jgi:hypothetical protein